MVGFGPKQAWLAVRETPPSALVEAMALRDLGPVPWRQGIDLAYFTDDRLVLTPPLPGAGDATWTLATGRWLLRAGGAPTVAALSTALGTEVQFFLTHRVSELHRWERAVDGMLVRSFEFVGESGRVTEWWGAPDAAEAAIGLPPLLDDDGWGEADILVGEDDVRRIARAWSVDPTSLDGRPAPGPLRAAAA